MLAEEVMRVVMVKAAAGGEVMRGVMVRAAAAGEVIRRRVALCQVTVGVYTLSWEVKGR